ncbi:MAG: hypothetical protein WKF73_14735 [Nocardioidaceae bacterium]
MHVDLATTSLLARDVVAQPLQPVDGRIAVRTVSPEPEMLAAAQPGQATERRWLDRLARCERLLAGSATMNESGAVAVVVMGALRRAGIFDVVLAPGSRSAPAGTGASRV